MISNTFMVGYFIVLARLSNFLESPLLGNLSVMTRLQEVAAAVPDIIRHITYCGTTTCCPYAWVCVRIKQTSICSKTCSTSSRLSILKVSTFILTNNNHK